MSANYPPPPPGQNPYGQPGAGYSSAGTPGLYPGPPAYDYARWGRRVGAALVDAVIGLVAAIPLGIGYAMLFIGASSSTDAYGHTTFEPNSSLAAILLILVGFVLSLAVGLWNTVFRQGRTGYSVGKGVLGIKLVGEATGQPIGPGLTFVRQLAHFLDGLCYIGYLWPLWDAKRQTFADKVMSTVVVNQPQG